MEFNGKVDQIEQRLSNAQHIHVMYVFYDRQVLD